LEYFTFVIFYSIFAFTCLEQKSNIEKRGLYYLFAIFVALVIGSRGIVDEYSRLFDRMPDFIDYISGSYELGLEKGYLFGLISSFLKSAGFSSQSLLLFFALCSLFFHAYFYPKFTKYYAIAFLFYLSHEIINKDWIQIRSGLSSALVLPMIYYAVNQHKKTFLALWLISSLIQYVGILSVVVYGLNKRIRVEFLFAILIISILVSFSGIVQSLLLSLDQQGYLPSIVSLYIKWKAYSYDLTIFHFKILEQICILCVTFLLIKLYGYKEIRYFNIILNVYFLSTISFIILSQFAIFSVRIGSLFNVVEPLMIVYLAEYFKKGLNKNLYFVLVIIGSLLLAFVNYIYTSKLPEYELFVGGM